VENLFDDKDDNRKTKGDAEYDEYFANDKAARDQKLQNLCTVLLGMNEGAGPDILAIAELESERAADLLRLALNRRIKNEESHYRYLIYERGSGGRNIAPAIISRIPVDASRTQILDPKLRILQGQVTVEGQPLVILASHWTSRLTDKTGDRRAVYGDKLYGRFRQLYTSNPKVDLIICGDFNDNPDEKSVTDHLRATGDERAVRNGEEPRLFNLFARLREEGQGSHYYSATPHVFDQICVSPGMLDKQGWSCEGATAQIIKEMATRQGRPNRFGGANDKRAMEVRGASDHFPVTVRVSVRGR
jgi:endonuclease/exonuclease/phosphatase family metal-dependent hydrolase